MMTEPETAMKKEGFYEEYWKVNPDWTPDLGVNNADEQLLFGRYLKSGQLMLDYGCGNGRRYGHEMVRRGLDYRGFDVSETALAQAKESGLQVGMIEANGSIGLPSGSVDVAICFEVLEHLMEPELALDEIWRAQKPGAILLVSVPNAGYFTHRIDFLLTGFRNPGGSPLTARKAPWNDPHIRFFNRMVFNALIKKCGYDVVEQHSEAFSLNALPWLYRQSRLQALLKRISWPFAWLGKVFPSVFSPRMFVVARKPVDSVVSHS
jgi:SAM-dependent methyltransferase